MRRVKEKIPSTKQQKIKKKKNPGLCIFINIKSISRSLQDKHSWGEMGKDLKYTVHKRNITTSLTNNLANSKSHVVIWNFLPLIRVPKLKKRVVKMWRDKDSRMVLWENMIWHNIFCYNCLILIIILDTHFLWPRIYTPNKWSYRNTSFTVQCCLLWHCLELWKNWKQSIENGLNKLGCISILEYCATIRKNKVNTKLILTIFND